MKSLKGIQLLLLLQILLSAICINGKGAGRTAFTDVPPNNFPFYDDNEKYIPMLQSDGAQLSGEDC